MKLNIINNAKAVMPITRFFMRVFKLCILRADLPRDFLFYAVPVLN